MSKKPKADTNTIIQNDKIRKLEANIEELTKNLREAIDLGAEWKRKHEEIEVSNKKLLETSSITDFLIQKAVTSKMDEFQKKFELELKQKDTEIEELVERTKFLKIVNGLLMDNITQISTMLSTLKYPIKIYPPNQEPKTELTQTIPQTEPNKIITKPTTTSNQIAINPLPLVPTKKPKFSNKERKEEEISLLVENE